MAVHYVTSPLQASNRWAVSSSLDPNPVVKWFGRRFDVYTRYVGLSSWTVR